MRKSPGLHETLTNTATIRADRQLQSTGADKNQLIIFLSTEKGAVEYFKMEEKQMAFFQSAVGVLQTLVIALGAGLGIWGVVNLMEGYGNDNPGAKSQGIKQLMVGGGVALIGTTLVPLLSGLFKSLLRISPRDS